MPAANQLLNFSGIGPVRQPNPAPPLPKRRRNAFTHISQSNTQSAHSGLLPLVATNSLIFLTTPMFAVQSDIPSCVVDTEGHKLLTFLRAYKSLEFSSQHVSMLNLIVLGNDRTSQLPGAIAGQITDRDINSSGVGKTTLISQLMETKKQLHSRRHQSLVPWIGLSTVADPDEATPPFLDIRVHTTRLAPWGVRLEI
jgi:hypothetical protein